MDAAGFRQALRVMNARPCAGLPPTPPTVAGYRPTPPRPPPGGSLRCRPVGRTPPGGGLAAAAQ
jgi:hypothetical protein